MARRRKPEELPVAEIVARMAEETRSDYRVADHAKVDWCPCCGVNLRFYDEKGALFAKLIGDPETMLRLAHGLAAQALQMRRLCPDERAREAAHAEIAAAVVPSQGDRVRFSEDACPSHIASESDAKVCRRCGTHIDSLRPPEDQF